MKLEENSALKKRRKKWKNIKWAKKKKKDKKKYTDIKKYEFLIWSDEIINYNYINCEMELSIKFFFQSMWIFMIFLFCLFLFISDLTNNNNSL